MNRIAHTSLTTPPDGPCAGHPCDNCTTCQRGRCCRRDNPTYTLPDLGAWDGPIYGDLGVLADDGEKVQCHCCGAYYHALPVHVYRAHDVTVDEYKALFGLPRQRGLTGPASHAKRHASMKARGFDIASVGFRPTPEQRSAYASVARRRATRRAMGRAKKGTTQGQGKKRGSSSAFTGVYPSGNAAWQAMIGHGGKTVYIGTFATEEAAARAYDRKAHALYGDQARLNLPDQLEQP